MPMSFRLILVLFVLALLVIGGLIAYGYSVTPTKQTIEIEVQDAQGEN